MIVLKTRADRPTIRKNPKIVLPGHGTYPGIPNLNPASDVKTGHPLTDRIKGSDRTEPAGKHVYSEKRNAAFSSFPAEDSTREIQKPKMAPHKKLRPIVNTFVAMPAVKATHSMKYTPTRPI